MATGYVGNRKNRLYVVVPAGSTAVDDDLKKATLVQTEVEAFLPAAAADDTPSGTARSAGASAANTYRLTGALSRSGGGKTQSVETFTPWGDDSEPVPLGGDATFNEVTANGAIHYDDSTTDGLEAAMSQILGMDVDKEIAVIVESKPTGLDKFVYRVEVGKVSTTASIDDANPSQVSFGLTPTRGPGHILGSV